MYKDPKQMYVYTRSFKQNEVGNRDTNYFWSEKSKGSWNDQGKIISPAMEGTCQIIISGKGEIYFGDVKTIKDKFRELVPDLDIPNPWG